MSGNRYVLDTNAIVALLQGSAQLLQLLQDANWVGISVISQIEFLVFSGAIALRASYSTISGERTTRSAIALIILHEEYGVDPLG
ncbi:MAG: hypothetical protein HEQ35_30920 [Gloeotrichia echinulata IR180]